MDADALAVADDPDVVWHYTDGAGLISILTHHCLWATSSPFLNDRQEVAIGLERLTRRLVDLAPSPDDRERLQAAIDPRREGGPSPATFFILSAAAGWDSLAMWRLYGGARESYAIGLDATARLGVLGDGLEIDDASLGRVGVYLKRQPWERVRYTAAEQDALIDAVVDTLPADVSQIKEALRTSDHENGSGWNVLPDAARTLARDVLDDFEQAVLLIKHAGFAEERETRHSVVMWADVDQPDAADVQSRLLRYRATGYGIAPYLCLTGGAGDDAVAPTAAPLPIRAVALSPSPNGPVAEASVRRLLESRGYDVPVLRSTIPFRA